MRYMVETICLDCGKVLDINEYRAPRENEKLVPRTTGDQMVLFELEQMGVQIRMKYMPTELCPEIEDMLNSRKVIAKYEHCADCL